MRSLSNYSTPFLADIAVYARNRHPLLSVEVSAMRDVTAEEAADWRSRLLENGLVPDSAFLLLAFPETLFLWHRESPADSPPDYVASGGPVWKRAGRNEAGGDELPLYKSGMRFRLFSWLLVLAYEGRSADPTSEPERMLIDAGVYDRMRYGDVRFEDDT